MKIKKLVLFGGMLSTLIVPIAAIISCGKNTGISRYDAENDGKLSIAATFSATGPQSKALQKIIEKYNAWVVTLPKKDKAKGYMQIKPLATISGGYGKAVDQLGIKFTSKDKKTLNNLVVDYPSSVAIIKSYGMQLNLKDVLSVADFKVLKNRFEPAFWSQNDKIGGVKPGGAYAIPVSVSTMANAINTPILTYVIDEINRIYPGTIDLTNEANSKLKALYDNGKTSTGDIEEIKNLWGTMTGYSKVLFKSGEITDSILSEFDTLIEFIIKAQKAFGKKVDDQKQLHLLALDSPTNVIQMLSYAYANGDMSKFYVTKGSDGYVHYKFLQDKRSDSYKNFEKGINLLRKGVESGAIWIGGIGAYGSSLLINHQAMMSLGSTAGATHWYTGRSGLTIVKNHANSKVEAIFTKTDNTLEHLYIDGERLTSSKTSFKVGKYDQTFFPHTTSKVKHSNVKFKSGYSESNLLVDLNNYPILVKVATKKDVAFKALTISVSSNIVEIGTMPGQDNAKIYLVSKDFYEAKKTNDGNEYQALAITEKGYESITSIIIKKGDTYIQKGTYFGKHQTKIYETKDKSKASKYDVTLKDGLTIANLLAKVQNDEFIYLAMINNTDLASFKEQTKINGNAEEIGQKQDGTKFFILKSAQIEIKSNTQTLQDNEVQGVLAPNKVSGQSNGGVYVQGPSFIPVHSNYAEDKAIALFIKWFVGNHTFVWKEEQEAITPLQYWLETASYIAPIKGAFDNNSPTAQLINTKLMSRDSRYWKGVKIAWDTFNNAKNNNNINPIIQPVDDFSTIARNDVTDVAIKKIYTFAHTTGNVKSFINIYKGLKILAKSSKII